MRPVRVQRQPTANSAPGSIERDAIHAGHRPGWEAAQREAGRAREQVASRQARGRGHDEAGGRGEEGEEHNVGPCSPGPAGQRRPISVRRQGGESTRPPSLQCRHSVRPRPARPKLTAPPCTRRRPACRMSTSRGSGNDFAARPAQQPQHLHGAPIIMRVQHPARGRRTEVSIMLQHVQ